MKFKVGDKVKNGMSKTVRTIKSFNEHTIEYHEGGWDFLEDITLVHRPHRIGEQLNFNFMQLE